MARRSIPNRKRPLRLINALVFAGALLWGPAIFATEAGAQVLGYASAPQGAFPSEALTDARR